MRETGPLNQSPIATARQNAVKARDLSSLRLLPPLMKPYKKPLILGLILVLVAGICTLGLGWIVQGLVDNGIMTKDQDALRQGIEFLTGLIVVLALASYGRLVLLAGTTEQIMADLRGQTLRHLLQLDIGWFENQKTGDLITRLTTDINVLQILLGSSLPVAVRNLLIVSGGLALMLTSSLALSLMTAVLVPVLVTMLYIMGPAVRQAAKFLQEENGRVGANLSENFYAIREIQAFTRENVRADAFNRVNAQAVQAAWAYVRRRGLFSALVIAIVFLGVAALLWVGGRQVIDGTLTPGQLSAFVFYALLVAASVGALSEIYGDMLRAAGALERIDDIWKVKPVITAPPQPLPAPSPAQGVIAFEDVSFAYATRMEQPALNGITQTFQPGEIVAIVGPSGSGKTTLFNLVLRFYDPTTGRVTFDGTDIRRFDPNDYRRHFAFVPQDPTLFSTTIRDNITFADTSYDRAAIEQAAKAAGAHAFIAQLPDGYDTVLGERGTRLSGGQAQRLALARALLRDPLILLLDEATAHLDSETERVVHQALRENRRNRTTLIIAHRLSTIQKADRILVLDGGRLVASGTHELLLQENALYRKLAATISSEQNQP